MGHRTMGSRMLSLPEPPRQLSLFPEDNEAHDAMERLVDLLLEPVGRAQRAKAAAVLRRQYALLSDLGYSAMRELVA